MRANAIAIRDYFGGGVSFGGGTRGVWVLCKLAPATLYPHHSVGVLAAIDKVTLRLWHRLLSINKNANRCRAWWSTYLDPQDT
jgi:hypothetical protein